MEENQEEWLNELNKQIRYEKEKNEYSFKACKKCGDKGFYLSANQSNNMYYLCFNYCSCNTGSNLRQRYITKENGENK